VIVKLLDQSGGTGRGGHGSVSVHSMNYRHHYHAGNFADCVKHALFVALLRAMLRKDKPVFVLDTHAGIGQYDVNSEPARKTGEWRSGFGRAMESKAPALADYIGLAGRLGFSQGIYPGSPALARALLRPRDRLAVCELHDEDAALLRRNFRDDKQIQVHHRDGYEALTALLPPAERRGLILIDPPFERTDEFIILAGALAAAWRKFPHGVYAAWYPVKHRAPVRAFFDDLKARGIPGMIAPELLLRKPVDPKLLNGCGLVIINPPFGFIEQARTILAALAAIFVKEDGGFFIPRLADE
jgi:23S rRNA (adenine2030-N6)-methyltransferase